ncbi:MAG: hypothetical protein AB7W28_03235 [Armatimonadota bacterium]
MLPSLLSPLDEPRKTFVALRYLQSASGLLGKRPVDRPGAVHAIQRALVMAPNDPLVLARAGEILLVAEDYRAAADIMARRKLTGLNETISYGHCLLLTDRPEEGAELVLHSAAIAQTRYRSGQMSAIEYALSLNNAAYALAEGNCHLEAAKRLAQIAVQTAPLESAFCDTLGWLDYKLQDHKEAAFYLERAVRRNLKRPDPVVLYHLGCAYASLNYRSQAGRFLSWSLALDPNRLEAAQALRQLYRALPTPTYVALPKRTG